MTRCVRLLLCVLLGVLCGVSGVAAGEEAAVRVVRVGFFPMRGYHHYDRLGKPAGYDVDYLDRVAAYARWEVRYVPLNSWEESLAAVERGEVDIMGATLMDAGRLERFEYSTQPVGSSREVLLAKAESSLIYEDFEAFAKIRVGCVRTSLRRQSFLRYASINGFQPEMVYFDTVGQMRQAMSDGGIDAMVAAVLEVLPGERILAEFAPAPFYYIAPRGATELMVELNTAMKGIKAADPDFEERLMARWYPQTNVFPFSRRELDYIRQRGQLTMSLLPRRWPFSVLNEETGVFEGIVPDILRLVARESGLDFVLSPMPEGIPPVDALESGLITAAAGLVRYEEQLRDRRLLLTDAFYTSTSVMLGRKGEPFSPAQPLTIAVPPGYRAARDFLTSNFPHFRQVPMLELHDALDAVRDGRVDGFMQNSYLLQPHLQGPQYAGLAAVPEVSFAEPLAIAVTAGADPLLLSVLNKSIRRLHAADVRQIAINHVLAKPYVMSFTDILLHYRYPLQVIVILSVLCLVLLGYGVQVRRRNMQLIRENEETLKNITNNINGGVITLSTGNGFSITYANRGFLELLGYSPESFAEKRETDCMAYIHPGDVAAFNTALLARDTTGGIVTADVRVRHQSGRFLPVLVRGTVGRDKDDNELLYCVIVDISEHKAMIRSLEVEKERYRLLLEYSSDILFEYDAAARFVSCSPRFRDAFAITAGVGDIFRLPLHPDDEPIMEAMLEAIHNCKPHTASRVRLRHPTGIYSWCRLVLSGVMANGSLQRVLGRIEDIQADVLEQQRIEEMVRRDKLCGLLNRRTFRTMVDDMLRGDGVEREGVLFLVDVDDFRSLNAQMGQRGGDAILQEAAATLRGLFRDTDPLSRYGGDQFCLYARDMNAERGRLRAEAIREALRREYTGDNGETVRVSVSVGLARSPAEGLTCASLLDRATATLRQSRERYRSGAAE